MQTVLQYTIPHHIGRIIHQLGLKAIRSLDLGCGTGLTGIVLREASANLTGVDIAAKMLRLAEEKGIYDKLVLANIFDFFAEDKTSYDLIVAADVLPYFGKLNKLFEAIEAHLRVNGYFIFTTEISTARPWNLETTARFSHHPDYISKLIKPPLQLIQQEKIPARMQNDRPLEEIIYVLRRE